MEFSLDTGSIEEVKKALDIYPVNCFSMNPSIVVKALSGTHKGFLENAIEIRKIIGNESPLYLQAMGDTAEEMIEDAHAIVKAVYGNTLIKIPACPQGFKAIRLLKKENISCSCTTILDVNQAMLAAECGAVCVAVYVSRLDNAGGDGLDVVKKIKQAFTLNHITCHISAASIHSAITLEKAFLLGVDDVTVNMELLDKMATHSLTAKTLKGFKDDWEGQFGKGIRVANMV